MTGEVKIGDKTVEMMTSGFLIPLYDRVFGRNLNEDIAFVGEANPGHTIDTSIKLAFLMCEQAKHPKPSDIGTLMKLGEKQFFEWINQFEPYELQNSSSEIMAFYTNSRKEKAKSKKE